MNNDFNLNREFHLPAVEAWPEPVDGNLLPKGKEITGPLLARVLRPYGVRPKTMWIAGEAAKGI